MFPDITKYILEGKIHCPHPTPSWEPLNWSTHSIRRLPWWKAKRETAPEFQTAGDPLTRQLITLGWVSPNRLKSVKTQEVSPVEKEDWPRVMSAFFLGKGLSTLADGPAKTMASAKGTDPNTCSLTVAKASEWGGNECYSECICIRTHTEQLDNGACVWLMAESPVLTGPKSILKSTLEDRSRMVVWPQAGHATTWCLSLLMCKIW